MLQLNHGRCQTFSSGVVEIKSYVLTHHLRTFILINKKKKIILVFRVDHAVIFQKFSMKNITLKYKDSVYNILYIEV